MSEYRELDAQLRKWLAADEAVARAFEHAWAIIDEADIRAEEFWERFDDKRVLADIAGKRALLSHVAGWPHELVDGDWWFSCSQAVLDDGEPGSGCADEKRKGKPCDCGLDGRRLAVLRCVAAGYVERPEFKDAWRIGG